MKSPLEFLSADAQLSVLDFLSLSDLLQCYCKVSKASLQEILPNLKQRRRKQFLLRYAYQYKLPETLRLVKDVSTLANQSCNQYDLPLVQPVLDTTQQWHVLPSTAERLQGLYSGLPLSHPANDTLKELVMDLRKADETSMALNEGHRQAFEDIFSDLQSLAKAHRLHEYLLSESTVKLNHKSMESNNSVSLDQYLGDCMIASCLMGNSVAGIVEGITTYEMWFTWMFQFLEDAYDYPLIGYQFWVFMHSSILRIMPATMDQWTKRKSLPVSGIQFTVASQNISYIQPHCPYYESSELRNLRVLRTKLSSWLPDMGWTHRTRLRQFGPLGPAFRGRDDVRMLERSSLSLFHGAWCDESPAVQEGKWLTPDQLDKPSWHAWFRGDCEIAIWMQDLVSECYKNRPMSVAAPVVTLDWIAVT